MRSASARGGPALLEAVLQGVDALAVEVDGVDLFAGRAEGPLIGTLESLGTGLLDVLGGRPRAQVSFPEAGLELVVARDGPAAHLTIVSLQRPARVVAREVEVDLGELVAATRDAVAALVLDLQALHATALDAPIRGLGRLADQLGVARPLPPPDAAPPSRGAIAGHEGIDDALCSFALEDDAALIASYRGPGADLGSLLATGSVVLRATDRSTIVRVEGAPFLVLRDLVAFAGQVVSAVRGDARAHVSLPGGGRNAVVVLRADLTTGMVEREGFSPYACPPLLLARAICDAALDLVARLVDRNPRQERNGWVTSLRADAEERRAQLDEILGGDLLSPHAGAVRGRPPRPLPRRPLGPGLVRRLVFRRTWSVDVGTPARGAFSRWDGILVAAGERAIVGVDARTGEERWRAPGASRAWARGGLFAAWSEHLVALDPSSGRDRGSLPLASLPNPAVRSVERISGGLALITVPAALAALDPGRGAVAWTFAPPGALELRATGFGPLVVAASDTGFVYGIDAATGQLRWRINLPGPVASLPTAFADACIVACEAPLGGALVSLDPATGHRRFEVPLDGSPAAAPVPFAGLLGVPGTVAGDALVTAVDPSGQLAWEESTALGPGAPALAALPSGLLAKTADGACTALDRAGEPIWSRPAVTDHARSNPPPVIARGVALVASERVDAIDPQSGALLGEVPIPEPLELICGPSLDVWGLDADGLVTAARLETHLSLVRGRP